MWALSERKRTIFLVCLVGFVLLQQATYRFLEATIGYEEYSVSDASLCNSHGVRVDIQRGQDPNHQATSGDSPLFEAAAGPDRGQDCVEVLMLLVASGGDVSHLEHGNTIFKKLVQTQNNPGVADFLIALGADPCRRFTREVARTFATDIPSEAARRFQHPEVAARLASACEGR